MTEQPDLFLNGGKPNGSNGHAKNSPAEKKPQRVRHVPTGDDELRELVDDNFLQYASYVIRDRAIPDLDDGLKPVQRRICLLYTSDAADE